MILFAEHIVKVQHPEAFKWLVAFGFVCAVGAVVLSVYLLFTRPAA